MSSTIESVLQETRVFRRLRSSSSRPIFPAWRRTASLVAEFERDFEGTWGGSRARTCFGTSRFTKVSTSRRAVLQVVLRRRAERVVQCSTGTVKTQPDKIAILFEADDARSRRSRTNSCYHEVCKLANALKVHGVKKGDRVLIYMPMSIQVVTADAGLRAHRCDALGSVWRFFCQEPAGAHHRAGATEVITADGQFRGGKEIPLKPVVDEAFAMGGCENVRNVIVYKRTGSAVSMQAPRDKWWTTWSRASPILASRPGEPPSIRCSSSTPRVDGKPKGVQHSTGGYLPLTRLR